MGGEVGAAEARVVRLKEFDDARAERPAVHRGCPFTGELLERVAQVRVKQRVARRWRSAAGQKDIRAIAYFGQQLASPANRSGGERCQSKAVAGVVNCIARDALHVQSSEALVQAEPAIHRARHGDRQRAIRRPAHAAAGSAARVQSEQFAFSAAPHLGEQVATWPAHMRPDHAEHHVGGDGRVDRAAAIAQHVDAC